MTEPQKVNKEARLQQSLTVEQDDPTLSAVRSVMAAHVSPPDDLGAPPSGAHLHARPENRGEAPSEVRRVAGGARTFGRAALPELEPQVAEADVPTGAAHDTERESQSGLDRLSPRFLARRWLFNRKIAIALVVAGVFWWRPWLIPGLIFLTIWVALIVYLTVGPDRLAELFEPLKRRFAARFPDKAELLGKRAQAGARQLSRLVQKLPEKWRGGVDVPQFGATAQTDADLEGRPDPFDRLAAERQRDPGHFGGASRGGPG